MTWEYPKKQMIQVTWDHMVMTVSLLLALIMSFPSLFSYSHLPSTKAHLIIIFTFLSRMFLPKDPPNELCHAIRKLPVIFHSELKYFISKMDHFKFLFLISCLIIRSADMHRAKTPSVSRVFIPCLSKCEGPVWKRSIQSGA